MEEAERERVKAIFLEAFALNGNILLACRKANIDRSTVAVWCEHDTEFLFKKNQAERSFFDLAFGEFTRRAIQGYEDVVTNNAGVVYWPDGTPVKKRVVSDRLLEMIIKRGFPEYREKQQVEHTGSGGGPIEFICEWGGSMVEATEDE